jgi:hypothetical protein
VRVPKAYVEQAQFEKAVARAVRDLAPDLVSVTPTFGEDWSGEPAVFFMVILADSATSRDRLLNASNKVSQAILDRVQPVEQWEVFPYFNFRSKSEQDNLDQPALV